MIIGLGIDTVSIRRIQNTLNRWGERFKEKVFTEDEIRYCDTKIHPPPHYAVRFAAKEAFYKALGSMQKSGIRWREIEVKRQRGRPPYIVLHGKMKDSLYADGGKRILLSMAHDADIATAAIVIEK